MVVPDVEIGLTILPRADGLVPMIDVVESLTMSHATTGEANELRFQCSDGLCKVFTESMALVGVLREERNHVECCLTALLTNDA